MYKPLSDCQEYTYAWQADKCTNSKQVSELIIVLTSCILFYNYNVSLVIIYHQFLIYSL